MEYVVAKLVDLSIRDGNTSISFKHNDNLLCVKISEYNVPILFEDDDCLFIGEYLLRLENGEIKSFHRLIYTKWIYGVNNEQAE